MKHSLFSFVCLVLLSGHILCGKLFSEETGFDRLTLTEEFHSEGTAITDIDGDQKNDIVSGPFWYKGPDFRQRFRYASHSENTSALDADRSLSIKGYSQHFFTWTYDFNRDGFPDILTVGMPGDAAYWFENPGVKLTRDQNWTKRKVHDDISNESPAFLDIDNDKIPELICIHGGGYVFIKSTFKDDRVEFSRTLITDNLKYGRFTHGMGIGDVDGDGRMDLLETNGWWKQMDAGQFFKFHPFRFAQGGGAQMFAYDFDGDGDNDVICSQNAHGYGLKWFEQVQLGKRLDFIPHTIMSDQAKDNPFGLAVSQMHAAELVDMDGDGIKDLITGKRYWAHGGADPGSKQLPLLFWLKTIRRKDRVMFEPKLVDVRSGVGTQVTVGDINKDGRPDIAVGNKLGSYVFLQNPAKEPLDWATQPLLAGTQLFYENVRSSDPLKPEDQLKTFVLPQGFEIQLVAAEPDINKPMNLAFDARGRLWVSSSREYPFAAEPGSKPRDAIKILEDTDGDGRADKITTFADGLNIPMGLLPYGDGVICFSIPNIWYLRDTDGDGKVDKRQILYGPFDTSRDTHGMCSSFRRGNDGWIYACHGFNNQSKVKGKDGHEVTMHSGNIFRFRPDGSRIEVVSHGQVNPFGMTIDSFGDIFTADCHTKPINLVLPGGHHDSFGKPHDGLGYIPNVMEHLHDSTGIGGVVLGENTNFPTVYQRSTFGGNVVTGRVNRNHLLYRGSSMRAREESDFVIPGDPWFRPVNLQVGPDGALYIADFYNRIIGHYEVDLKHPGRDRERGRIWRVVYRGNEKRRDSQTEQRKRGEFRKDELTSVVAELQSANRSRAQAIITWIINEAENDEKFFGQFVLLCHREDLNRNGNAQYWMNVALHRSGRLTSQLLKVMLTTSPHEKVRCLGYQLLSEFNEEEFAKGEWSNHVRRGLVDSSPAVQRFAATTARLTRADLVSELMELLSTAQKRGDRYLVHATKIALREQFRADNKRLAKASEKVSPDRLGAFADICMTVPSVDSADFLVKNLSILADKNPGQLNAYLQFAAKHASEKSIDAVVTIVDNKFANNSQFQMTILDSLRTGLEQKQRTMPASIKESAGRIARSLMRLPAKNWAVVQPQKTVSFGVRRMSITKDRQGLFIDTLSRGESATGILRSAPIKLKKTLEFRIAGHDGQNKDFPKRNLVRIVLKKTGKVIGTVFVPTNDTPALIRLSTKTHEGQTANIEIVDGSDGDSFAWIAVGEFQSHPELNPHPGWSVDPEQDALAWTCLNHETENTAAAENIFVQTNRRTSADGQQATPLWSSIVKGERRTGVYRSEPFELEKSFRFYIAGHGGFPDKSHNRLTYVQLRLAANGRVIYKILTPRNDTAQPVNWDTSKWVGQKAFVELVDQDSDTAFAWVAAGRFSIPGLNPSRKSGDRLRASQIVSRFRLKDLKPDVIRLIDVTRSMSLKSQLCQTLISLETKPIKSRSLLRVCADMVAFPRSDRKSVDSAIKAIRNLDTDLAQTLILAMLKTMTVSEQGNWAELLVTDRTGGSLLVESIENGIVASSVLNRPALVDKLKALKVSNANERIAQLVKRIPKIDPSILKVIEKRKQQADQGNFNLANGKLIFEKNCSNCHQLGGHGKQVGPNLDGIGNRGVERLLDDILLPNRNVDAAFRATLIATADGRIVNGLVKKGSDNDKTITIVNNEGKEAFIPILDIEQRKETTNSPMPANFSETIPAKDFNDLIGYLLSSQK